MTWRSATLVALAVIAAPAFLSAGSEQKIAYVDLERALNQSNRGKAAKALFEKKQQALQSRINTKENEIKKLGEKLEKQAGVLAPEARKEKEREYEVKIREYQRLVKDSQDELARESRELTGNILRDLRDVIQEVGKKGGYSLILERNGSVLLYASGQNDITEDIVQAYDGRKK